MFGDTIIIIDKAMTGNIYYKEISQGTWYYVIGKILFDYIEDKNVLNFLIYISMLIS